eukprot:CAMPEP_0170548190 /NCGR_PEP_ID=MMETSP0211-20121228/6523_1 /TAXON_ID=311385 /ORGANISM="Pseudokeronopsis sp., Strain OXSARD2" /LENGTH=101 /DNA_ID=CAMNT_0010853603 /DNA_START=616 /DNA_END=921 /DNA_ORIENTATION=-
MVLLGTSVLGQHALSHQPDLDLNTFLGDKFSFFFNEFLYSAKNTRNVKLSDFSSLFPFSKVESDIVFKTTHQTRSLDQIYLSEFLPLDKLDVVNGRGSDKA